MSATANDLEAVLEAALERPVQVSYGRARQTVVRAEVRGRVLAVRLNAMFRDAPPDVQEALAAWLRSGKRARRASALLDTWIDERLAQLRNEDPRPVRVRTQGEHHDLALLAASVLRADFAELASPPPATWGRRARSRSRHTLRLGSYNYGRGVVRIHTVLDQPAVPDWFVRFVLFHEYLHAALDEAPRPREGRRHHGPEFRRREQAHADYARAVEWEKQNVNGLIVSARTGKPLRAPRRGPSPRTPKRKGLRMSTLVQRLLFD